MIKFQIKRGTKEKLPSLSPGEFGLTMDVPELYIGGNDENLQIPLLEDGKIPNDQLPDFNPSSVMAGATASEGGTAGLVPAPAAGEQVSCFLRADGTWAVPVYPSVMTGATSSTAGGEGLVPAPAAGKQASFLRGDGTWAVPIDSGKAQATQKDNKTVAASSAVSTITLSGTFAPLSSGIASRLVVYGVFSSTSAGAQLTIKSGSLSHTVSSNVFADSTGSIVISALFDGLGWRFEVYRGTDNANLSYVENFYWMDIGADALIENITLDLSGGPAAYRVFPDSTWKLFGI